MSLRNRLAWAPRAATTRPLNGVVHLHRETTVPTSLAQTFAFFSDAANLEALTPPWLNFRVITPLPIRMREGAEIDYQILLYGVPIPWKTRITVWKPGVRFADRQLMGPYLWWQHEHRFEAMPDGTRVTDDVEFVPRARWVSGWMVRRDVERIFTYRQETLQKLVGQRAAGVLRIG